MNKPKIELVDFNNKKPNLQSKGFTPDGIPNGRIIATVKELDTFGATSNENWSWKVSYENFNLGKSDEHDETWGNKNENRKLGGTFPSGYNSVKFIFEITRTYVNGNEVEPFKWFFAWTQEGKFVEIVEDENPIEEPIDCKKYIAEIKNLKLLNVENTEEIEYLERENQELKKKIGIVKEWKFFTAFNPKLWDWDGLWEKYKLTIIPFTLLFFLIMGIIIF